LYKFTDATDARLVCLVVMKIHIS